MNDEVRSQKDKGTNEGAKRVDSALDFLLTPQQNAIPIPAPVQTQSRFRLFLYFGGVFLVTLSILHMLWWRAPREFPAEAQIGVPKGMTIGNVSKLLAEKDIVRSPFWFKAWSVLLGGKTGLKAGEYYFSEPISVAGLAWRLSRGIEQRKIVRVTVPEGLSNKRIAEIFSNALSDFDAKRFQELSTRKEGYLFPDTYIFPAGATEEDVIKEMEENFAKRILPLQTQIRDFKRPLKDVLIMASLVEGEVRTTETRRQVSGILWKRLQLGMPLQVDAVFPYIIGKNTFEVTTDDLKIDSPYNTYLYVGLPPGPINNPGLDAITAAITPTPSNFLYYLTDLAGQIHYAATHAEHLINRAKYLGK